MNLDESGMNLGWIWDETMSPSGVPKEDSKQIPGFLAFTKVFLGSLMFFTGFLCCLRLPGSSDLMNPD